MCVGHDGLPYRMAGYAVYSIGTIVKTGEIYGMLCSTLFPSLAPRKEINHWIKIPSKYKERKRDTRWRWSPFQENFVPFSSSSTLGRYISNIIHRYVDARQRSIPLTLSRQSKVTSTIEKKGTIDTRSEGGGHRGSGVTRVERRHSGKNYVGHN